MIRLKLLLPIVFSAGFVARYVLLCNSSASKMLRNRIEVSTPLSSWKRATEGISLNEAGVDPYDGDIFHESPLALFVYSGIASLSSPNIALIFAACDLITAGLLALSAYVYLNYFVMEESNISMFPKSACGLLTKTSQIQVVPFYVASIYLFCPFAIAACCGKSTVVFLNLLLALFILLTSAGMWLAASIVLGVISCQSFYHVCLIAPLILFTNRKCSSEKSGLGNIPRIVIIISSFIATVCLLLYLSHESTGSWNFLMSTYGFTFSVPDLTPNIGLFWYFFTEMFEHFREFFLWTFQLNAFIYTIPLAIRLRKEPMLLLFVNLILIALFKPYPCVGDVALYISLIPVWQHLFTFMRQSFLVGCIFVSCSILAPTLWHLWIYSGSANANFYFAITLVFNTGQIFLLTDILSAFIKRGYYLENGITTDKDGNLILLRLK